MSDKIMEATLEKLRELSEQRRGRCIYRAELTSGNGVILRFRIAGRCYDEIASLSPKGVLTLHVTTALRVPKEHYVEMLTYLSTQDYFWSGFDMNPDGGVSAIVRQKLDTQPVSGTILAQMEDNALRLMVRHIVNLECIARGELPQEGADARMRRCETEMLEHPMAELAEPVTIVERVKEMIRS